jgi:hypothetical protein
MGDRLVESSLSTGNSGIKSYASTYTSGEANVALVNTSASAQTVEIKLKNFRKGERFYWYQLQGSNDNGEFSRKVIINGSAPAGIAGGPADYASLKAKSGLTKDGIRITMPGYGMVAVTVEGN